MLPEDFDELVLDVVARIPPGKVMSYGDIAEYLGVGGPRQVGAVMSRSGGEVPWWRVLRRHAGSRARGPGTHRAASRGGTPGTRRHARGHASRPVGRALSTVRYFGGSDRA